MGQHYDTSSSTFICPYHGVYFFSLDFDSYKGNWVRLRIMRNNKHLVTSGSNAEKLPYNHGSAFVVTECDQGDIVRVVSYVSNTLYVFDKGTLFSGYLLFRYIN